MHRGFPSPLKNTILSNEVSDGTNICRSVTNSEKASGVDTLGQLYSRDECVVARTFSVIRSGRGIPSLFLRRILLFPRNFSTTRLAKVAGALLAIAETRCCAIEVPRPMISDAPERATRVARDAARETRTLILHIPVNKAAHNHRPPLTPRSFTWHSTFHKQPP